MEKEEINLSLFVVMLSHPELCQTLFVTLWTVSLLAPWSMGSLCALYEKATLQMSKWLTSVETTKVSLLGNH